MKKSVSTFAKAAAMAAFLLTGLAATPSLADGHGKVMAKDAWARARTAPAKVAGAFMTLHNMTKQDDRLVGAKSSISARTEVHTHEMKDGVMKMIHVKEGIELKAGQMVEMKPGGYHIMFMGLKEQLSEGKEFPVTLVFEKAGDVNVTVSVKKAGAMKHGHGSMKHDMKKMDHGSMKKSN